MKPWILTRSFSPDGKKIAYQSDHDGRKELWVMNADGSDKIRLTNSGAYGHFINWSADGAFIIFAGSYDGKRQLMKIARQGGQALKFAAPKGTAHSSFSPDYLKIMDVTGHSILWVYNLESGESQKVFPEAEIDFRIDYPVWSPNGTVGFV